MIRPSSWLAHSYGSTAAYKALDRMHSSAWHMELYCHSRV
jgi:hypothetical protein